jgi:hypothetical protein
MLSADDAAQFADSVRQTRPMAMVDCVSAKVMELLLNLVWITLALGAFCTFLRKRRACAWTARVPYITALLALSCMLVLLFPVVSASDDLHPTQAVLEDATKRVHQIVAPLQHAQGNSLTDTLPALLAIYLLCSLVALQSWQPISREARVIFRERAPRDGRSPPRLESDRSVTAATAA